MNSDTVEEPKEKDVFYITSRAVTPQLPKDACKFNGKDISKDVMNMLFDDAWELFETYSEIPKAVITKSKMPIDKRFTRYINDVDKLTDMKLPKMSYEEFIEGQQELATFNSVFTTASYDIEQNSVDIRRYLINEDGVHRITGETPKGYEQQKETSEFTHHVIANFKVPIPIVEKDRIRKFVLDSKPRASHKITPFFTPTEYNEISEKWTKAQCFASILQEEFGADKIMAFDIWQVKHISDPSTMTVTQLPMIMAIRYRRGEKGDEYNDLSVTHLQRPNTFSLCDGDISIKSDAAHDFHTKTIPSPYTCVDPSTNNVSTSPCSISSITTTRVADAILVDQKIGEKRKSRATGGASRNALIKNTLEKEEQKKVPLQIGAFVNPKLLTHQLGISSDGWTVQITPNPYTKEV